VNRKRCGDGDELSYVEYARVNSSVFSDGGGDGIVHDLLQERTVSFYLCVSRNNPLVTFIYRHFRNILTYLLTYFTLLAGKTKGICLAF